MLVLGIETSTGTSSVALGSESGIVASMLLAKGRGHAEFLVPAVRTVCEQAGIELGSLTGVAVGLGPGLFTGMRVGVVTAKTIAQGIGRPIVGIASPDLLAFTVRHSPKLVCVCVDAKRREVFSAFYRRGVQREGGYMVMSPERLAAEVEARGEEVLFVGNGALAYRDRLESKRAEFALASESVPRAEALVELALGRFEREEYDSLMDLEPLYVRKADAEINWEQRGVVILRPNRVKRGKS